MVPKHAETVPSPDKKVFTTQIKIYVFLVMKLLFTGN